MTPGKRPAPAARVSVIKAALLVWGRRQSEDGEVLWHLGLNPDSHSTSWVTLEKLVNSSVPPFPNGVSFRGCENKVGCYV